MPDDSKSRDSDVSAQPTAHEAEVYREFKYFGSVEEVVDAVRQLRADYDEALQEIARLREALADIADGYERHNPGWWIKKAKAALKEDA